MQVNNSITIFKQQHELTDTMHKLMLSQDQAYYPDKLSIDDGPPLPIADVFALRDEDMPSLCQHAVTDIPQVIQPADEDVLQVCLYWICRSQRS